jgi:broad specificity phosphatase PhoE
LGKILIVNTGPVKSGPDRELSPEAVAQAVAGRLSEYKISAIYAFPVVGADEMAQVIAGRFGLLAQPLPGPGEAMATALDDMAVKHKKETVIIVSQPELSVTMLLHLLNLDDKHYRQIAQDPGAVNLFEVRFGVPSALYINDTCHLASTPLRGTK